MVFDRAQNYTGLGYNLPDVRVIKLLLSFGVDTNERYDGTTVWRGAVEAGYYIFTETSVHYTRGIPAIGISAQNERRWIETMKIML